MRQIYSAAFAVAILGTSLFSHAQNSTLKNHLGKPLAARLPLEFVVDTSMPVSAQSQVLAAVEQANQSLGYKAFQIIGYSSKVKGAAQDGINLITYADSSTNLGESEMSRSSTYWSETDIHEVDITINGSTFDIEKNPEQVRITVAGQLLTLALPYLDL